MVRLDKMPIALFQHIERDWFQIPPTDPTHTKLPTLDKTKADDPDKYWR